MRTTVKACLALGFVLASSTLLAAEQTRPVTPFSTIRTQGALSVEVVVGSAHSITVKGDDKYMEKIVTDIAGDELLISYKDKKSIRLSDDLKVVVTMPNLSKFKMEGAGLTTVNKINGDRFELNYEGVGLLKVSGKVNHFKLRAQGIGFVDAKGLQAESVDAVVEGIGSVEVTATDKLKANVQGIVL
ncbi:MAG: DUF2807 domain-containing protein [Burkholderiales bacterium]|nr:DUF2807 domain-containing protein [Burkholderiales bacterium]